MRSEPAVCDTGPPADIFRIIDPAYIHVPALRLSAVLLRDINMCNAPARTGIHLAYLLHLPRVLVCLTTSEATPRCACAGACCWHHGLVQGCI